jgi:PIN domain nuclease of toxin-antitoxin system
MSRVLIDTHVLLWWLTEPERLKVEHLDLIKNPDNIIEVSVCSLFEIATKRSIGKLIFEEDFKSVIEENGFRLLKIDYPHLEYYATLPIQHKDPYDRMIISQAIVEDIGIISYNRIFKEYSVNLL